MQIQPFKLERYFAKYEFSAKYLMCSSDCDGLSQSWLLSIADEQMKNMWDNLKLGYTESLGLPLLREEVSKLYTGISREQVLIVTPEEGVFIALNTLLQKDDHVICVSPGYQSLYSIAKAIGCEVTKWQPQEEQGWKFDLTALKSSIKDNTKLLIINFPHNPTGYIPSKIEFNEIITIAKERNIQILSDEMYRFLEYAEEDRLPSASEMYDNAVSLFGMSKTFGMAGVRIGWLVTKNSQLYQRMAIFKDFTTICSSAPSELLSVIGLRAKEQIIQANLVKIQKNLALLDDFFARHSDSFSWVKPKAGTIGFPKLKRNELSLDFCEKLVQTAGVMLLPSTVYDYGDHHIRIGFGRENMPEALAKLEEYL